MKTFPELLKRAGITKAELSRKCGYCKSTVYHWQECPQVVRAYLELLIEYNRIAP